MLTLIKPFFLIIGRWIAIISGVLLVLFKIRQSGTQAEQRKEAMETLAGVKTRDKIENDIARTSDSKLNKLCKKWTK